MKPHEFKHKKTGRREFISRLSIAAATGFIVPAGLKTTIDASLFEGKTENAPEMPMISLGPHKISRLICGCNPMLGYSYLGAHTDHQMKEYFTPERIVEFLAKCSKAGMNTHQSSFRTDYFELLHRQKTGLNIISLQKNREDIKAAIETARPIAIVHHGGISDKLFAQGKSGIVHDFVKDVKSNGLLAGVSAHNPDVIKQIANEGWEVDFFMTSFYFVTREDLSGKKSETLPVGVYNFVRDDPKAMTDVIRQVSQPCLAFKILGAGRRCSGQEEVRDAFQFAFEHIKPTDGVIVGMFPWFYDEITANVQYATEFGKLKG